MSNDPSVIRPPPPFPVVQTSMCTQTRHPDEVTVRFLRFKAVGFTAYQKGQEAGFLRARAEELVRMGVAIIVEQP